MGPTRHQAGRRRQHRRSSPYDSNLLQRQQGLPKPSAFYFDLSINKYLLFNQEKIGPNYLISQLFGPAQQIQQFQLLMIHRLRCGQQIQHQSRLRRLIKEKCFHRLAMRNTGIQQTTPFLPTCSHNRSTTIIRQDSM